MSNAVIFQWNNKVEPRMIKVIYIQYEATESVKGRRT